MIPLIVGIAAVLTGILSAVAGLGGGIVLLAVLAQFFAPTTAIPIQGGIQLASNLSRTTMLRAEINWSVVWRTAVPILPASLLGVALATSVPEDATLVVIAIFLLTVTWRPQLLTWRGKRGASINAMFGVGAASGFLNSTVGASGAFTSHFFRAFTSTHVAFVATAAASQVFAHLAKLIAFGAAGFDPRDHVSVMVAGAVGTIAGTRIGGRLLHRADEKLLERLFHVVLTSLAIRLLVKAIL
ncbi:MAG: putative membrane protein YfcA [Verrucomicrobiales bacterium]|jgi:uncharacterized membrane protein YfcA